MNQSVILDKKSSTQLTPPSKYQVILLNDDYTTMDFVIEVLMRFFAHNYEDAYRIMMNIHLQGRGVCGVYSFEIAEMKVFQVSSFAKENQFPLRCILEKIE